MPKCNRTKRVMCFLKEQREVNGGRFYTLSAEEVEEFAWVVSHKTDAAIPLNLRVGFGRGDGRYFCFWYLNSNGEWDDSSYKKGLIASRGKRIPSENQLKRNDVIKAFRQAVYTQSYEYRVGSGFKGKGEEFHVDHKTKPFQQILEEFLESEEIDLLKIELDNFPNHPFFKYRISNEALRDEWALYHSKVASFQVIPVEDNYKKISRDLRQIKSR